MLQDPVANADLLKPFEVDTKSMAKEQTVTEQHDRTPAKETSTAIKMAPVDPNKVDWDTIEKQWGIKRDDLEKSGAMQQMVYNHKSPQLLP